MIYKDIRFLISVTLLLLNTFAAISRDNTTAIAAAPEFRDFGHICIEDGPVECVFTLTNNRATDVVVKVLPSCGCLTVDRESVLIKGNGSASLKVCYDNASVGKFSKQVVLVTSDSQYGRISLTLSGESFLTRESMLKSFAGRCGPLCLSQTEYSFPTITAGTRKILSIPVYNSSNVREIIRVASQSPGLCPLNPSESIESGTTAHIIVSLEPSIKDIGRRTFTIAFSDEDGKRCQVRINTAVVPPKAKENSNRLVVDSIKYSFGDITKGKTASLRIPLRNNGDSPITINKVDSISPELHIKYPSSVTPGGCGFIELSLDASNLKEGPVAFVITVYSDNVANTVTNILVTANIVCNR